MFENFQITTLEPMISGLQEALPKSIGLLSFDGGVAGSCKIQFLLFFFFCVVCIFHVRPMLLCCLLGCMRLIREQLNWGTKAELKTEVLRGIKEIGSVIYTMGLLDIVLVSPIRWIVRKLTSLMI